MSSIGMGSDRTSRHVYLAKGRSLKEWNDFRSGQRINQRAEEHTPIVKYTILDILQERPVSPAQANSPSLSHSSNEVEQGRRGSSMRYGSSSGSEKSETLGSQPHPTRPIEIRQKRPSNPVHPAQRPAASEGHEEQHHRGSSGYLSHTPSTSAQSTPLVALTESPQLSNFSSLRASSAASSRSRSPVTSGKKVTKVFRYGNTPPKASSAPWDAVESQTCLPNPTCTLL